MYVSIINIHTVKLHLRPCSVFGSSAPRVSEAADHGGARQVERKAFFCRLLGN